MNNAKGMAILEILLVAVIVLALGYMFMRQRQHQSVDFSKQMKEAGVKLAPGVNPAQPQAIEKAVEAQLKATTEEKEKDLEKKLGGGN
jgi:Tfp pilus assembly protein PilO